MGIQGVGGYEISVECYITNGLPGFEVVGLPDTAVKEARDRVRAAIKNSGFQFSPSKITVNMAPADTKKVGTFYDLPICVGILACLGTLRSVPENAAFLGELSLSGEIRPVRGALPMAIAAERCGIKELYIPVENADEAAFAQGVKIYPVPNVRALVDHLNGVEPLSPAQLPVLNTYEGLLPDFADVKGQYYVKRALEIAAAGGHNVLMVGPPGSGKSMLARRIPGIMPDMTRREMLEATEIHSVAGRTNAEKPVVTVRPFRAPHHTVSSVALAGGGAVPHPGEASLAHHGILFLDELPEFSRETLEVLRQPLEDGEISVSRVSGSYTFPSRFMLVCAMNPCKCGWYGDPSGRCRCSEASVRKYHSRISGPLLDRIDIIVEVPALRFESLKEKPNGEPSRDIKARVNAARLIQRKRFGDEGTDCNAHMQPKEIREYCELSPECTELIRQAFNALGLTARSYDRILKVSRTIADLAGSSEILPEHIAEAVQYRTYTFEI